MGSERPPPGKRRLAALASLVCFIGAPVVLLFAFTRVEAWRLVVAVAAIVAADLGVWWVLSRRRVARLIGSLVTVTGVVVLVAVIVTAELRGLPIIAAAALMVLAAAAARYALARDPASLKAAPVPGVAVGKAAHPVLLMNLKSGGGKAEQFHLVDECRARGIEPVVLHPGEDLLELARDAVRRGADVIGMAGGDGSQALVASVAAAHDIPHVCVPAGTRNHFALDLGLDRNDVVGALDGFGEAAERRIDLARVNGRVFVNNATMGLYAKIVQSPEYRDAKLKTTTEMLPQLIGPDAKPFDLRFSDPDGRAYPSAQVILVSNNPYQLTHAAGRGTRAQIDAGVLGVVAARITTGRDALAFITGLEAGRLERVKGWQQWSAPTFTVDSADKVEIGIDGEALVMAPPLVFESMPGSLRIRIPHHAPGVSPAGTVTRFTSRTLADLAGLVGGRQPRGAPSAR